MTNSQNDQILGQFMYGDFQVILVCNADETVFQVMTAERTSSREERQYKLMHSGPHVGPATDVFEDCVRDAIHRTSTSMVSNFMQHNG